MRTNIHELASRRTAARLGVAFVLSIAVHVLTVTGVLMGQWNPRLLRDVSQPQPAVVLARIQPAPSPPAPPPPVVQRPAREAKAAAPKPDTARTARAPLTADTGPAVAPVPAATDAPAEVAPAAEAAATPALEPAPAPVTPAVRTVTLPQRAKIEYEITLEPSNNSKAYGTQTWSISDGRYKAQLKGEFKVLAFVAASLTAESRGMVKDDGLRMSSYRYERNGKTASVSVNPDAASADIYELSGNRKSVPLTGTTIDLANLAFYLASVPDIAVGTTLGFFNRDNLEEVRLAERRDEPLSLERMNVQARFYDFQRADGSGGAQIWLATDRQWLPAKMRVTGRDGVVVFEAISFDLNPPRNSVE